MVNNKLNILDLDFPKDLLESFNYFSILFFRFFLLILTALTFFIILKDNSITLYVNIVVSFSLAVITQSIIIFVRKFINFKHYLKSQNKLMRSIVDTLLKLDRRWGLIILSLIILSLGTTIYFEYNYIYKSAEQLKLVSNLGYELFLFLSALLSNIIILLLIEPYSIFKYQGFVIIKEEVKNTPTVNIQILSIIFSVIGLLVMLQLKPENLFWIKLETFPINTEVLSLFIISTLRFSSIGVIIFGLFTILKRVPNYIKIFALVFIMTCVVLLITEFLQLIQLISRTFAGIIF